MGSSSEEEAKITNTRAKPGRRLSALAFVNPFTTRTTSAASIYTLPDPIPGLAEGEDADRDLSRRALVRSRSEDVGPRVRDEWGSKLEPGLRESANALRTSVFEYEKEATEHQWKDLLKINTDITDLGKLADTARKKKSKKPENDDNLDGLSKFSTVALEYSKMLDVVMNQSPEYAGLAWGAIRMLLVAHTNHSKLKHAVEHYIILFGQEFGLVNNLMNSHPTQKMVDAVTEAYTAFAKFLSKAVKYYTQSRLTSVIKAFGFPWETRFQMLVNKIEAAFKRIKDIASAGHFGMTVQTHQMIETIGTGQENMRHEMRRNTIELREQLKLEMRDEVQNLFQTFDRNWITRFEQIMAQSIHAQNAIEGSQEVKMIAGGPKMAAIEYAESMTEPAPGPVLSPARYLADYVGKPKKLKKFRDKSFVLLQKLDDDFSTVNLRLRHTTTYDLQQIMGLLRNDKVRTWLHANTSHFLWVNTFKRAGPSDWATAFATKLIENAGKIENMTVLYHLCGVHSATSDVSTPTVLLQSLIMQLIQQHHQHFSHKVFPFTLEHFQDVENDVQDLWELFLKCCAEAKISCLWLLLDHLDNLQKGEDYDFLLQALSHVVEDDSRVYKVFVSARTTGTPGAILEAASIHNPSQISTLTVPRANSSSSAAFLSKQTRAARLPDFALEVTPPAASKADIDALLNSSSEEDVLSDSGNNHQRQRPLTKPPPSKMPAKDPRLLELKRDDTDVEFSDASMEFTRDNPFATSDEDSDEPTMSRRNTDPLLSDDDEEEGDFAAVKPSKKPEASDVFASDSSSDEPDKTVSTRSLNSRGRTGPLTESVRITKTKPPRSSLFDSTESDESGKG